jgi:hypothetical protein
MIELKMDNSVNFDVEERSKGGSFKEMRERLGVKVPLSDEQILTLSEELYEEIVKILITALDTKSAISDEEDMEDIRQKAYLMMQECLYTFDLEKYPDIAESEEENTARKKTLPKIVKGWIVQNIEWRINRAHQKNKFKKVSNRRFNNSYTVLVDLEVDDSLDRIIMDVNVHFKDIEKRRFFLLKYLYELPLFYLKIEFGNGYNSLAEKAGEYVKQLKKESL